MNYSYCKHSFFPGSYQSFHRHVPTRPPSVLLLFFLNLCFKSDSFFISFLFFFFFSYRWNVRNFATILLLLPPPAISSVEKETEIIIIIIIIVDKLNSFRLYSKKKIDPFDIINSTKERRKGKSWKIFQGKVYACQIVVTIIELSPPPIINSVKRERESCETIVRQQIWGVQLKQHVQKRASAIFKWKEKKK